MEYHVLPVDDMIDHEEDEDCVCGPEAELLPGGVVYVHHSLDNREAAER